MRGKNTRLLLAGGLAAVAVTAVVATAIATNGSNKVGGTLRGYQEVPAVSTTATGTFSARIVDGGQAINYTLKYSGLEADATQAHIHFGQKSVNGGISLWFCGSATNPGPAGTPVCPARAGTVTGTADASDVVGPAAQGIAAGELAELVRAIRAGKTYANVHSTKFPGGELRLQLRRNKGKH
jgi:hypothetical protein